MPTEIGSQHAIKRAGQNGRPQFAGELFRMAFWGVCGALAVGAAVMIHNAPQVGAAAAGQRAAEIADENRAYCEKWGMPAGTRAHVRCTLDLDEIRARQS